MKHHDGGERLAAPRARRAGETPAAGGHCATVCFVTRKWPPAIGGMETYSARLADELARLAPVRVLALPGNEDGSRPGALRLARFAVVAALSLVSARRAPGVVHVGDMASWPLALAARLRSRRSRIALSAHGTDVAYPRRGGARGGLYGAYMRLGARLLRRAVVVANSRATAEAVRGFGFRRVRVVTLATDVAPAALPAERHNGQVLFVGRLTPRKGCAWFIREVLPRLDADVALRVAGTVWDPGEAAALEHPRVRFLGPVRGEALVREYADALCVVIPNIDVPNGEFEGFGLTAIEAAAAGGLVLAARHSGLKDAVIDGETGFHLAPGDARGWAGKIGEIRGWSGERRATFLAHAVATTRRIYSWDRVARETVAAYAEAQ